MKKFIGKISAIIPAFALILGVMALNSACLATYHQPEISSDLDEFRR